MECPVPSRFRLLSRAKQNGASEDVLDALQKMPDREYDGPSGVQKAIF
ncbi:DUF2795 domain-containing protein [Mycobacterium sp.]|jgi:hypothetical protein|nr:DUF2795 domain-containing protein [Mycobacterium sp.]HZA10003.1 DUF2795 domain-containing protein [Mycobacterium sp.]